LVVSIVVIAFFSLAVVLVIVTKSFKHREKQAKEREIVLKSNTGGEKPYKTFQLKELKKATKCFSQDRILGSGGFGEVYKGELQNGTIVAVKKARVGNLKSTQQVLNEVSILSQVNHKNLVRLLGCCVESEQPLMIYEYISNGTLYDHLHDRYPNFLDWKKKA
jgi:serine/threonine protein kinase